MHVEVAYARPEAQLVIPLEVPAGTTAGKAIEASGIAQRVPGLDPARLAIGIFGRVISRAQVLEEGDRVEIYRPLTTDPKTTRRIRAAQQRRRR